MFIDSKFSIDQLSEKFECTNATITRNLKKELGTEKYQEIINSGNSKKNSIKPNKDIQFEQIKTLSSNTEEQEFNFVEYKLDQHFDRNAFYEEFGTGKTFPQVVCNGVKLGGCTETVKYLKEHNMV